jgi:TolB protein
VDAALGLLDCLEWTYSSGSELIVWHHLLNNDLVLPPVGGEDSINNLHRYKMLGSWRAYVHVEEPLTVTSWLNTIRKGHTFVSSGPLIEFRVNGKQPGEVVRLPRAGEVTLEGSVRSIVPLSKLVIHSGGRVVKEIPLAADGRSARFSERLNVARSAWFALYTEGPASPWLDAEYPLAISNVVRVYVGDQKIRDRASAEYFMRWIDKVHARAEAWPWWRSQREKDHVYAQFDEARRVYERLAQEARE